MLRSALLVMTAIAVVSDTMLLPYYPRMFEARFGISSPFTVGAYLAAISLTVMLALPLWVLVTRYINTLQMLVVTQLAAAGLSIACYAAPTVASFWVASLLMVGFKASYLLMYPYVIALQPKDRHAATIGALAVIVHFGGVLGALSGGYVVGALGVSEPFIVMAAGDVVQAVICIALLVTSKAPRNLTEQQNEGSRTRDVKQPDNARSQFAFLLFVMFCFYFGFYIAIPFTAVWWQSVVVGSSQISAGAVFAIPGFVAFAMLLRERKSKKSRKAWGSNELGMGLTAGGLVIQSLPNPICIIVGRIIYGVGLYQVTVGLDALFFERAQASGYAAGFSLVNIARNSGVMAAALVSGLITQQFGEGLPFLVSGICVAATLVLYRLWLRPTLPPLHQTARTA